MTRLTGLQLPVMFVAWKMAQPGEAGTEWRSAWAGLGNPKSEARNPKQIREHWKARNGENGEWKFHRSLRTTSTIAVQYRSALKQEVYARRRPALNLDSRDKLCPKLLQTNRGSTWIIWNACWPGI